MENSYKITNKDITLVIVSAISGVIASKLLDLIDWSKAYLPNGSINWGNLAVIIAIYFIFVIGGSVVLIIIFKKFIKFDTI